MSDITEELRAGAELEEAYDADGIIRIGYQRSLRWRAADEIERLRRFARRVLRVWPDGDLDGGDLQDAAVEAGLLVQRQVTEIPCGHGCRCVDYYDDDDFKAGRHVCYERSREALGE